MRIIHYLSLIPLCVCAATFAEPNTEPLPENLVVITGQLEPNDYTSFLAEAPYADSLYIDADSAIAIDVSQNISKAGSPVIVIPNQTKTASSFALLSTPPEYDINLNNTYSDTLTTASPESYYLFTITAATKFTALLNHQSSTNSNIDIRLYKENPLTMLYESVSGSFYAGSSNEQLSEMATPGNYLLAAYAVGPITGGSILIRIQTSTGADSNEPDDNFWQAKPLAANVGFSGNLDWENDVDFHTFTLSSATTINYSLTGGNNYEARLYWSTGALAFTLPSDVIAPLTLPAGTYYWAISSPTGAGTPSAPYTFSAYRDIASIVVDYDSDEGNYRRNWGAGNYFALSNLASFTGYAYDADGQPAAGAYIRLTNEGSVVGLQTSATVKTDSAGYFSVAISSPSGAGAHSFTGACLRYYYDVHTVKIQRYYGGSIVENIGLIAINEGSSQILIYNSQVLLNDVAYNIYIGC